MNRRTFTAAACLTLMGAGTACAQKKGGGMGLEFLPKRIPPPATDVMTDAQLLARQHRENAGKLMPKEQQVKGLDLQETSTFLENSGLFTIVPKGSVIHVPEKLKSLVVETPSVGSKFQSWQEFQVANRGRISAFEITFDQAAGKAPVDGDKLEALRRSDFLIVAVCRGGAISCPSQKPATVAAAGETAKPSP
ncbi:hypothetical protein KBB96_11300 [Luteolibacter ambystomatis]|uniref:Uncharacterized protein n=1 Tax=Luteolibacter ambystomatis TaxID=2824561 RepID=A0A975G514_9BACT|nr:hypothetical protein [Luteolibacter ambystomatis]QUE49459.1 hypothetical protein KBB96_11300 [Luteolibacter ambystomatis]